MKLSNNWTLFLLAANSITFAALTGCSPKRELPESYLPSATIHGTDDIKPPETENPLATSNVSRNDSKPAEMNTESPCPAIDKIDSSSSEIPEPQKDDALRMQFHMDNTKFSEIDGLQLAIATSDQGKVCLLAYDSNIQANEGDVYDASYEAVSLDYIDPEGVYPLYPTYNISDFGEPVDATTYAKFYDKKVASNIIGTLVDETNAGQLKVGMDAYRAPLITESGARYVIIKE